MFWHNFVTRNIQIKLTQYKIVLHKLLISIILFLISFINNVQKNDS